jgi:DNA-binding Lrp family transcriptional regulator
MHARAYVLIEVEVGQVAGVIAALRGLQGVRTVDVVAGPYDIIAVIELPDQRAIGRLVMDELHGIAGIKRTITCLAI